MVLGESLKKFGLLTTKSEPTIFTVTVSRLGPEVHVKSRSRIGPVICSLRPVSCHKRSSFTRLRHSV